MIRLGPSVGLMYPLSIQFSEIPVLLLFNSAAPMGCVFVCVFVSS